MVVSTTGTASTRVLDYYTYDCMNWLYKVAVDSWTCSDEFNTSTSSGTISILTIKAVKRACTRVKCCLDVANLIKLIKLIINSKTITFHSQFTQLNNQCLKFEV